MENKHFDFHEIKTFEDACRHLGISENTDLLLTFSGNMEAFSQADVLYKLLIIQKAINNGKWRDEEGWSYYPYWKLYSKDEMESMSEEKKHTSTNFGFPLCFNSEEAARYAAKQFEDLFFQYYGIKVEREKS